jgi:hypothetical protein
MNNSDNTTTTNDTPGYTPSNINLDELLKEYEAQPIIEGINLRQITESLFPGGINGLQNILDSMGPILQQREQIGERLKNIVNDVTPLDRNTAATADVGIALSEMFKKFGDDEELTRMMASLQDQYNELGSQLSGNVDGFTNK